MERTVETMVSTVQNLSNMHNLPIWVIDFAFASPI